MRRPKRFCSTFLVLLVLGVTWTSAITTKSKPVADSDLPKPTPTSSPATYETEFSSRRGAAATTTDKKDESKSSVSFKFTDRTKNSSAAASSKSPQIAYPGPVQDSKSSEGKEDGPQSLVLELLEDKEGRNEEGESPDSLKDGSYEGDGRSKYPRIFYGEASPPRHQYSSQEGDLNDGPKHQTHPEHLGGHPPKYFYPKSYVHNKNGHKGKTHKKKRFEYNYEEDLRHSSQEPQQGPEYSSPNPELPEQNNFYGGAEQQEGFRGFEQDSMDPSEHGYRPGGYNKPYSYEGSGHSTVDVISKALHLLIPSAILLTGLSAVFPNRIHVPTNDFRPQDSNQYNPHRHKRSIRYADFSNEMLEPEHRSMSDGVILPSPSYKSYNFEIGSARNQNLDFVPLSEDEYDEIQSINENSYRNSKSEEYNQKLYSKTNRQRPMSRVVPQSPEEYNFNYGAQNAPTLDSSFAPSSIPTPTLAALEKSHEIEKPRRKVRTRTTVKVRSGLRRASRPLPRPTAAAINAINELQSKLIGAEKVPAFRQINIQEAKKERNNFRLGDEYLKSLVESHDEDEEKKEKAKNMDFDANSPVMGLIGNYAKHDKESPICQKKALCELALKGKTPTATKFETFLWSLASLVPEQFSKMYELDEIFNAVKTGSCNVFQCMNPNIDLQV